jgi:ribosomal-protein-alanine N-acetyltransferase
LLDVAFMELHLHRITAHVLEDNLTSIRLLEGMGFEAEGICRDYLYLHGAWRNHIQYSLLNPIIDL